MAGEAEKVWMVACRGAGRLIPVQPDLLYSLISKTGFCLRDRPGELGRVSKAVSVCD